MAGETLALCYTADSDGYETGGDFHHGSPPKGQLLILATVDTNR